MPYSRHQLLLPISSLTSSECCSLPPSQNVKAGACYTYCMLAALHWLPVRSRIHFKNLYMVWHLLIYQIVRSAETTSRLGGRGDWTFPVIAP